MMSTELQKIPGVGPNIEEHLLNLGYVSLNSLKGEDPEAMYERDCNLKGENLDRCLLYIYRLAVYYAENEEHDPEKLKWWNWKH